MPAPLSAEATSTSASDHAVLMRRPCQSLPTEACGRLVPLVPCEYLGVQSPESCFDIVARETVQGGYSSATKEKLRIVTTEAGNDRELTVLLKRTSPTEVVALRAANQVAGATAIPRLVGSGRDSRGDWIAIPFYVGRPASTETAIPDNVVESLAAMHAQYLDSEPPKTIPVFDANWWRTRCAVPRLQQLARPSLQPIIDRIRSWSEHRLILDALTELPRTLLHGDVHRNNVIVNEHTGQLIDWGGGAYGMPLLDLINPGPHGSRGYERYAATWRALTGASTASPAWRRGYLTATVCTKVGYLGFAARHFGDAAALRMFETVATALTELERTTAD